MSPFLFEHCARWAIEQVRDLRLGPSQKLVSALPGASLQERVVLQLQETLDAGEARLRAVEAELARAGSDFASLPDAVRRLASTCRVVGFDVFDTLVVRRVDGEELKTSVAHVLASWLGRAVEAGAAPSVETVRNRRSELEKVIARERVARGEDDEVDYDALIERWVGTWVEPGQRRRQLVDEVVEAELKLEGLAIRPAPGIAELLAELAGAGKRLVFVSDMYLSASRIRRLLDGCGLGQYFAAGYSSTDVGLRKVSGRLFEHVLAAEQLRPDELLFVGDNPASDGERPQQLGIRTVLVRDAAQRVRRRRLARTAELARQNAFWAQRHLDEVMRSLGPDLEARAKADPSYALGLRIAPLLTAFGLQVMEAAEQQGIDRIFFLAREGLTFRRIHHLLARSQPGRPVPPERYLFLSRASTILASMEDLSWPQVARFWKQYSDQSLRRLLKNLSLPEAELLPLARKCGLVDPDAPIRDAAFDPAFLSFLSCPDVGQVFRRHRDRARLDLQRYLAQHGFFESRRVAFVDVGWKGSIQDNVALAVRDRPDAPEILGLYLGYYEEEPRNIPRSRKSGFLADRSRSDPAEMDLFRNTALLEIATTARHGTTVGYREHPRIPGVVIPRLTHHEVERRGGAKYYGRVQRAIFDYAAEFARAHPLVPYGAEALKAGALDEFLRLVRYPTRTEAEEFARYSHVESFGVHQLTRFTMDLELGALLRAPWKLRDQFLRNHWREAALSRSGVPLANVAYDAWTSWRQASALWREQQRSLRTDGRAASPQD